MPDTITMKFGGTSVRDDEARRAAREQVRRRLAEGKRVALVVSAMGRKGEPYATDTLIGLLASAGEPIAPRELDLAMSAGELLSAAYFAHFLNLDGIPAEAFTGPQAGFLTDAAAGQAEILGLDPARIDRCLGEGKVAVVAGFQGADKDGEIRTLGRGGSDTSAVALGAALGSSEVEIYTDVNGVAQADPRRVPDVRFVAELSAETMLAMAEEGSKVLHPRALRASQPSRTPVRVRNTFNEDPGTLIVHEAPEGAARPLALAHREGLTLLHVAGGWPWEIVPELLHLGEDSYLLQEDVHLEERIARLREEFDVMEPQSGWATASMILGGTNPDGFTAPTPKTPAQTLDAPAGVLRWLVRGERLDSLLAELYVFGFGS
jgi:aspartate kinase